MYQWISRLYIASGVVNISGVLLFSKLFTNSLLGELYPEVFSVFGLVVIIVWGLAYIAVASHWNKLRSLAAVFAVEKAIYFFSWIIWMRQHSADLSGLLDQSLLTGTFFAIYGLNDFLFMLVFITAVIKSKKS